MLRRAPTADDVLEGRDLSGRVMLVTGADSGIGFQTARALAARGARVWLGCEREETGRRAAHAIVAAHPRADVRTFPCDLGSLGSVGEAARDFPEPALHAVVCNAGVYGGPYRATVEGFERTLGVCYVGHAALVLGLTERLRAGAPSRVVMVSSENHRWPRTLDFDELPLPPARYTELRAYGQAKLCVILFAFAFDRRHRDQGIVAHAVHPGDLVSTGIDRDSRLLRFVLGLARPFSATPAQAAATSVFAATAPELGERGGRYFRDCREASPSPASQDVATQERLWRLTQEWVRRR